VSACSLQVSAAARASLRRTVCEPALSCHGPRRVSAIASICFCHFHQRADRPPILKSSPCAHGTRGSLHDYGSHEGIAIFAAQASAYPRVGNADAVADSQLRSD
jgi:hypothetical protein